MNGARAMAYGVLGLPLAFAALPLYMHVPRYYSDRAGLSLSLLGAILLGARLLDAVIDPLLGWLADRISRRHMLAFALPLFGFGFIALLHPHAHAAPWLFASLMLTYAGYSAATIAYQAWGSDLAADAQMQTRLSAAREGCGLLGVLTAALLPSMLAPTLNEGVSRMGWILLPMLAAASVVAFAFCGEPQQKTSSRVSLLSSLKQACGDHVFRRLLLVFTLNGIAAALPATLFLFFVTDVLEGERYAGPLLVAYFAAGAASLPLWVKLASHFGRPLAWLASIMLSVLAFAGAGLLGSGDLEAFAVICILSGAALGADLALPASIAADLGERQEQAGAVFGIWNFCAKLTTALAAGLSLPLLAWLGYVPGTGAGLASLSFVYAVLPLVFKSLAGVMLLRWRHSLEIR